MALQCPVVPASTAEAGVVLAVTNFALHENRYDHPPARRAEVRKAIADILNQAKATNGAISNELVELGLCCKEMTHLLHRGGLVTALSRTRVLRVEGPDALKFLQGIFTNDVHGLKTRGDVRYGAFLSHKGRTLTDAEVVLHEVGPCADALFLKVDSAAEEDMLKHLKKYKLRSKVTISAAHDYVRAHAILPSLADPTATAFLPSWTADQNETHRDGVVYVDPRSAAFGSTAILPVEHASCTSLVMHCV
ncbi:hypothetical protein DYB28_005492, partial [Aphanomyces astaci]